VGQSCGVTNSSSDELYITPLTETEELRNGFDSQSLLVLEKAARQSGVFGYFQYQLTLRLLSF
jgi:hypothetical protein